LGRPLDRDDAEAVPYEQSVVLPALHAARRLRDGGKAAAAAKLLSGFIDDPRPKLPGRVLWGLQYCQRNLGGETAARQTWERLGAMRDWLISPAYPVPRGLTLEVELPVEKTGFAKLDDFRAHHETDIEAHVQLDSFARPASPEYSTFYAVTTVKSDI